MFATENFQNLYGRPMEPPANKQYDLDAADDGEASEEPHGAPDQAELCVKLDLLVSLNVVKGVRLKIYLDKFQRRF